MDGIWMIVLAGLAGLCAALLRLCAVLAPRSVPRESHQEPARDTPAQGGAAIARGQ